MVPKDISGSLARSFAAAQDDNRGDGDDFSDGLLKVRLIVSMMSFVMVLENVAF